MSTPRADKATEAKRGAVTSLCPAHQRRQELAQIGALVLGHHSPLPCGGAGRKVHVMSDGEPGLLETRSPDLENAFRLGDLDQASEVGRRVATQPCPCPASGTLTMLPDM